MAANDIDTLADFGIFDSTGVARLAGLIRSVQELASGTVGRSPGRRRGRRPGRPRGRRPGRPATAATNGRGRRGKMTVSATELAEMRKTMTGKAIAQKLGVSIGTVTNHLKKHGLTGKRGRPAKKK
jgi:hypothetical protein